MSTSKNLQRMLRLRKESAKCWNLRHKQCDGNTGHRAVFEQCSCTCHGNSRREWAARLNNPEHV